MRENGSDHTRTKDLARSTKSADTFEAAKLLTRLFWVAPLLGTNFPTIDKKAAQYWSQLRCHVSAMGILTMRELSCER
jgi:hypothetical protein